MDYKMNVTEIVPSWSCCRYKFMVRVKEYSFSKSNYVVETLKKWFGDAEYFWDNCYLCELKK